MKYLVFISEEKAQAAISQINSNMGFPTDGINAKTGKTMTGVGMTKSWAKIRERLDACWCFPKPDDKYMEDVEGYEVETYNDTWFAQSAI